MRRYNSTLAVIAVASLAACSSGVDYEPQRDTSPAPDTTEADTDEVDTAVETSDDTSETTDPDTGEGDDTGTTDPTDTEPPEDVGPLEPGKCGDGVVNLGEECDDGQLNAGVVCEPADGESECFYCSVNCRLEHFTLGQTVGTIEGWVLDHQSGETIAGAIVSVVGGPTATTDSDGHFVIEDVEAAERVLVNIDRETTSEENPYSEGQSIVEVLPGQTSLIYPRLLRGCSDFVDINVSTGATATTNGHCELSGGFAQIAIGASGLVFEDSGRPFSGTARVDMIPIPIPEQLDGTRDLSAFAAFPGDMSAVRVDGSEVQLQSYGAAEFRITDPITGDDLQIAPGTTANLRMQVYLDPGTTAPVSAWWYDRDEGQWIEEGFGTFVVEDGITYYDVEVAHLTPWNCDEPLRNKTCVWGVVTSADGGNFPRLQVDATGVSYAGNSNGYTDNSGQFCVDVAANSTVRLTIPTSELVGYPNPISTVVEAQGAGNSCRRFIGDCTFIGNLPNDPYVPPEDYPVPPDVPPPDPPDVPDGICAQGTLATNVGVPVGADVTVTALDMYLTPIWTGDIGSDQASGAFCVNMPGETTRLSFEWSSDGRPCLQTIPITDVGTDERACDTGGCISLGEIRCGGV